MTTWNASHSCAKQHFSCGGLTGNTFILFFCFHLKKISQKLWKAHCCNKETNDSIKSWKVVKVEKSSVAYTKSIPFSLALSVLSFLNLLLSPVSLLLLLSVLVYLASSSPKPRSGKAMHTLSTLNVNYHFPGLFKFFLISKPIKCSLLSLIQMDAFSLKRRCVAWKWNFELSHIEIDIAMSTADCFQDSRGYPDS